MAASLTIEWDKYKVYSIRDIHEKFRKQVVEFVNLHICKNRLYQVLGLHKQPEIRQDLNTFLEHILENDCSIIAIETETNTIHAVALVKWMTKEWRSWTNLHLIIDSPLLLELLDMTVYSLEESAKNKQETWNSLHLFYFYVDETLRDDACFMQRFFKSICSVASHMHMPRVTYMALSQIERDVLDVEGFVEIFRVVYSMYIYKGRRPFDHLRDIDELYAALYEIKVEPIMPYEEMTIRHYDEKKTEK